MSAAQQTRRAITYNQAVRSYDHGRVAGLPAYAALRQALSDLGNQLPDAGGMSLAEWLDAVRDMAATAPYGDVCDQCARGCLHEPEDAFGPPCAACHRPWWPYATDREGGGFLGAYRCDRGHKWTCWYAISAVELW